MQLHIAARGRGFLSKVVPSHFTYPTYIAEIFAQAGEVGHIVVRERANNSETKHQPFSIAKARNPLMSSYARRY